jgi:YHS domain-containing protein
MKGLIPGIAAAALVALAIGSLAGCGEEKPAAAPPPQAAAPTPAVAPTPAAAATNTPAPAKEAGKTAAPATEAKAGDEKMPKEAVCAVCSVNSGKQELESVKASLKYKGKTYYFCNLDEKAEFISNPSKYASAAR